MIAVLVFSRTAFFSRIIAPLERVSSRQGLSENDVVPVGLHGDSQLAFLALAIASGREGPGQNH